MTPDERTEAIAIVDGLMGRLHTQTETLRDLMNAFHAAFCTSMEEAALVADLDAYKNAVFRLREALMWMGEAENELQLRKSFYEMLGEEVRH